jgi:hypothetical protein
VLRLHEVRGEMWLRGGLVFWFQLDWVRLKRQIKDLSAGPQKKRAR